MRCHHCANRFPTNWRNAGPLESLETPGGVFTAILFLVAASSVLQYFQFLTLAYMGYGIGILLLAPWIVNWLRFHRKTYCPQCSHSVHVMPWSF